MTRKILFLLIIFVLSNSAIHAQDIHFSQFNESPQSVNPALTGYFYGDHRFIMNYKDQWRFLSSPYRTFAFSYDMGVKKATSETGYLALGAVVYNDKAGDLSLSTSQALLNIAYHLKVSDNQTFGAAISGGFGQKSLDMSNARWDDQYNPATGQYDPNKPTDEINPFNSFLYPDLGFGLLYSIRSSDSYMTSNDGFRANAGLGVHHLNTPKLEFYSGSDTTKLATRISFHGNALFGIPNTNFAINPGFLFSQQAKMQELIVGSNFRYTLRERSKYTGFIRDAYFNLGGFYRIKDAFVILTQIELDDFALGLSYDFNVSGLKTVSSLRGGLEVSLRYIIAPVNQKSFY
jgi:type IX secretion system PorP/SprF family membrane protein